MSFANGPSLAPIVAVVNPASVNKPLETPVAKNSSNTITPPAVCVNCNEPSSLTDAVV